MADGAKAGDGENLDKIELQLPKALAQLLRLAQQWKTLGGPRPDLDPARIAEVLAREAPGALADVARVMLGAQTTVLEANARQIDRITESLFGDKTCGAPSCRIALETEIAPGQQTSKPFRLNNPRKKKVEVHFTAPRIKSGGSAPKPLEGNVTFERAEGQDPLDFELEPEKEGKFRAKIDVAPTATHANYEGTSHLVVDGNVLGHVDFLIHVQGADVHVMTAKNNTDWSISQSAVAVQNRGKTAQPLAIAHPVVFTRDSPGVATPVEVRVGAVQSDGTTPVLSVPPGRKIDFLLRATRVAGTFQTNEVYTGRVVVLLGTEILSTYLVEFTVIP